MCVIVCVVYTCGGGVYVWWWWWWWSWWWMGGVGVVMAVKQLPAGRWKGSPGSRKHPARAFRVGFVSVLCV